jgi:hypothetical protein
MKKLFLYGWIVPILGLSLAAVLTGIQAPEKKIETTRMLFDVQLSPGATKLLNKVESLYGNPVRTAENPSLGLVHGLAHVGDDGVPEIQINPANGRTEATIVHELMHLMGFAEGVAKPILGPRSLDTESARQFMMSVDDQVEHAYFYPKMRDMGIDPSVAGKADLHYFLQQVAIARESGQLKGDQPDELGEAHLALLYFECVAVLQDKDLADELEKTRFFPTDEEARRLGPLAVALTESDFVTPNGETNVFIKVCNTFLEGKYHLSLVGFDERQRGKITLRYAAIRVERVVAKHD